MIITKYKKILYLCIFLSVFTFIAAGCGTDDTKKDEKGGPANEENEEPVEEVIEEPVEEEPDNNEGGNDGGGNDGGGQSPAVIGSSGNPVEVEGFWVAGCKFDTSQDAWAASNLTFIDSESFRNDNFWRSIAGCIGPPDYTISTNTNIAAADVITATLAGSEVPATRINLTDTNGTLIINNPSQVEFLSSINFCGDNQWESSTPQSIDPTDCGIGFTSSEFFMHINDMDPNNEEKMYLGYQGTESSELSFERAFGKKRPSIVNDSSGNPNELEGSFKTVCFFDTNQNSWVTFEQKFSGSSVLRNDSFWRSSPVCEGPPDLIFSTNLTIVTADEIFATLGGSEVIATELDITISDATLIVYDEDLVITYKGNKQCGSDEWEQYIPMSLLETDCGLEVELEDIIHFYEGANPPSFSNGDNNADFDNDLPIVLSEIVFIKSPQK